MERRRGGSRVISRMYSVSPLEQEKFFLRLLLLHRRGVTGYTDLRTIDGEVLSNFREACIRLHLLADYTEYHQAMVEASAFQMPRQLQQMFATICIYCQPTDPLQLWNNHQAALTEDYARDHTQEYAANQALHEINIALQENGSNCTQIGIPEPCGNFLHEMNHHHKKAHPILTTSTHNSEVYWKRCCMKFLNMLMKE